MGHVIRNLIEASDRTMNLKNTVIAALFALFASSAPVNGNPGSELMAAAGNGEMFVVKALLDRGVDINFSDNFGFTALMFAARRGHGDMVRLLLAGGADVNVRSKLLGYTALMSAITSRKIIIIKDLLNAGADINVRSDDGNTVLTYAEELGDSRILRLLIKRGALK